MSRLLCLFALFLITALPRGAFAQANEGVRCVQAQLTAAGFEPGPTDGLLGSRTRSALDAFQQENGTVSTRPLETVYGDAYCRLLGLSRPDLRQYWPSNSGAVEVIYGDSISEEFRSEFERALNKAQTEVRELLELEFAGRDVIIVADNPAEIERLLKANAGVPIVNTRSKVRDACKSFRNFSGSAYPGIAYFCKSPDAQVNRGVERAWMDFNIAHEYLHLLQFQLSGGTETSLGPRETLRREGPVWLIEGVAQAFGNRVALGVDDWEYRVVMYRRLENALPDLAELEQISVLPARTSEVYRAGTVGAVDLIDLYGYPAIFDMYARLGQGEQWPEVFEASFGTPVESFYSRYREVTRFNPDGAPIMGPLTDE